MAFECKKSDRHDYVSPTVGNDYLYNEDAARGAEELLITEGVTDCISAHQAGVACISPVTTRFRKQDVPRLVQLTRHAKRIVVCNDAEANGAGEAGGPQGRTAAGGHGRYGSGIRGEAPRVGQRGGREVRAVEEDRRARA